MANEVASDWQVLVPFWTTVVPRTLTHTSGAAAAAEPVSSVNDTASRAPRTAIRPLAGVEHARSCRRARIGSSYCSGVTIGSFARRGVYWGHVGTPLFGSDAPSRLDPRVCAHWWRSRTEASRHRRPYFEMVARTIQFWIFAV
jgi:hypothetical protein